METRVVPSKAECGTQCIRTDGCLAINVIQRNDIICELTSGLSNENEMEDNITSTLFVMSMLSFEQ